MTLSRRAFLGSSLLAAGAPRALFQQAEPYVLVLGVVQDGGLPQAGCYSERCERARSEPPRYVASLAIVVPEAERFYLVDASPNLAAQMDLIEEPAFRRRATRRDPFDGIFLTHAHMGHYLGLALLGREGLGIQPTPCYCSPAMERYLTDNGPWSLMVEEGRLEFPRIPMERWTDVDGVFDVRMMPVPHRPEFSDTVAYMFRGSRQTILYVPDIDSWEAWDRPVAEVVAGVDVALIDGSFYSGDEVPGRNIEDIPHPLIPHSMDLLQDAARTQSRVVFIHLNNTNPALDRGGPAEREIERRRFEVAREGLRIPL